MKTTKEQLEWIVGEDTGISSKVIWAVMLGLSAENLSCKSTPSDPSDFGRCYRLLRLFPKWEERVHELGELVSYAPRVNGEQRPNLWGVFASNYAHMKSLYEQEVHQRSAPKLYKFMKDLGF